MCEQSVCVNDLLYIFKLQIFRFLLQNKSRIDIGRLQRLSTAFGRYTVSGLTVTNPVAGVTDRGVSSAAGGPAVPVLDSTAKEALKVVFSRDGSYAQVRLMLILCFSHVEKVQMHYGGPNTYQSDFLT